MIKTKSKPAERAVTAPGFDYDGLPQPFVAASRKRAEAIKQADADTGKNLFEMGRLLKEQRDAFGSLADKSQARGTDTWDAWVKGELGWARNTANRLIQVTEVFGGAGSAPPLSYQMMKLLASGTGAKLREQVLTMAQEGKTPTLQQVQQMKKDVAGDDRPTPTEAKARAKATGEVVVGSDNKYYTPLEEAEVEAYTERRRRTYAVLDAVKLFADMTVTPTQWLGEAERHQLIDLNLGSIEVARDWLVQFAEEYRQKEGIIDGH